MKTEMVKILKRAVWCGTLLCGICFRVQAGELSRQVVPMHWDDRKTVPLEGEFAGEVIRLLQNTNKYAMNTWYNEVKKFSAQTGEYLDFGGKIERFIRPVSHEAFALAVCLRLNLFDPAVAGVSRGEAIERTVKLISSLAYRHKANSGKSGWGDLWQSALWAAQAATAGWMMWDFLTPEQQEMVCKMTVYEADRFLDYKVPYYRDVQGKIIYKGDSKAEENAWNSNILVIAKVMMPGHPHEKQWMRKAVELMISAYAAPSDLQSKKKVNGFRLNEVLNGSNIEENGLVVNHGIIHADYMCSIMHNTLNVWMFGLAGMKAPQAAQMNGGKVYYALTDLDFDGKTMYVKGAGGGASSQMYYPQGNDWGLGRQDGYWLMDILAYSFGWDARSSVKAEDWAKARNRKMQEMQGRFTTGQYYGDRSENKFDTREEWYAAQLAFGYLGLWEKEHKMVRFTNKAY